MAGAASDPYFGGIDPPAVGWKFIGTADMEPYFASIQDCVRLIGLSRSTVYELLASGAFRATKVGKRTLVDMQAARQYIAEQPSAVFNRAA